jgi:hypothetical protein
LSDLGPIRSLDSQNSREYLPIEGQWLKSSTRLCQDTGARHHIAESGREFGSNNRFMKNERFRLSVREGTGRINSIW